MLFHSIVNPTDHALLGPQSPYFTVLSRRLLSSSTTKYSLTFRLKRRRSASGTVGPVRPGGDTPMLSDNSLSTVKECRVLHCVFDTLGKPCDVSSLRR